VLEPAPRSRLGGHAALEGAAAGLKSLWGARKLDSPRGPVIMLNRAALILRYKQPFVDWINAADPSPTSHTLTLAEVNQEHTVYLVEVEDEDDLAEWLARHHEELFEQELNGRYTDPALWPGPVAQDAAGVVFVRAPHRRGGYR
jgi:hypothetical protein